MIMKRGNPGERPARDGGAASEPAGPVARRRSGGAERRFLEELREQIAVAVLDQVLRTVRKHLGQALRNQLAGAIRYAVARLLPFRGAARSEEPAPAKRSYHARARRSLGRAWRRYAAAASRGDRPADVPEGAP
jgi:hypothetical protein